MSDTRSPGDGGDTGSQDAGQGSSQKEIREGNTVITPQSRCGRSEVIFKKSSNLYCRLDLGRVLMVGTKVSKGFFV